MTVEALQVLLIIITKRSLACSLNMSVCFDDGGCLTPQAFKNLFFPLLFMYLMTILVV